MDGITQQDWSYLTIRGFVSVNGGLNGFRYKAKDARSVFLRQLLGGHPLFCYWPYTRAKVIAECIASKSKK